MPNASPARSSAALREVVGFELRYQVRQPAFWIATAAFIAFGVLAAGTDVGALEDVQGRVARNAPLAVVENIMRISAFGMFAVLVFVAGAGLRDVSSRFEPFVFCRPVASATYAGGRFLGALIAAFASMGSGVLAMAITALALQGGSPELEPVTLAPFAFGVCVQLVPNTLLLAAAVFLFAVWFRRLSATFLGLLGLAIAQDVAESLPISTFGETLPGVLDPLGFAALKGATRYWSAIDYRSALPELSGTIVLNRVTWVAVAIGLFALALRRFERTRRGATAAARHRREPLDEDAGSRTVVAPGPRPSPGNARSRPSPLLRIARFELGRIFRSPTFWVTALSGLGLVVFAATRREAVLGVESMPVTRLMLMAVQRGGFLPLTLLALLFASEVVWRERATRASETFDALPLATAKIIGGKLVALAVVLSVTTAAYGLATLAFQRSLGVGEVEVGLHAAGLALIALQYVLYGALAVVVHALSGSRFLGFAVLAVFVVTRILLQAAGYANGLYLFAGGRPPAYSDMDGWGHGLAPFLWTKLYWTCAAGALLVVAGLFWPRGRAAGIGERLARARRRLNAPARVTLAFFAFAALFTGGFVGFQQTGSRRAPSRDAILAREARYERTYRSFADTPVPRVTDVRAEVDVFANDRSIAIRGDYAVENPHGVPLERLAVGVEPSLTVRDVALTGGSRTIEDDALGFHVFAFDPPLAPGATARLTFDVVLETPGFGVRESERWVRRNGTFLLGGVGRHPAFRGTQLFPTLGYDATRELDRDTDRSDHGLGAWSGLPAPDAPGASERSSAGAEWTNVELVVSTPSDQRAVAPGVVEEEWEDGGRRYTRFRTSKPVRAFFPIVAGRLERVGDEWNGVALEVFHHPRHAANAPRILGATRTSLATLSEAWGPYRGDSLRLAEFPGYAQLACSFPGVMGFAESMGFLAPPLDEDDVDPVLWVVAHEVAHQWWNGLVAAADARGSTMVSETLAQYGALRVVEDEYGSAMTLRTAEYYREVYLQRRGRSGRSERPLVTVEDQDFVHYAKGYVAMRSLVRQAGFEPIDAALRSIVARHAERGAPFVTSTALLDAFRARLPDELQPVITDLFERIVFIEAAVEAATARPAGDGAWAVSVDVTARRFVADGDGNEVEEDVDQRVDVAVYGGTDTEKLLAVVPHPMRGSSDSITITVPERPSLVRLNPELLYLDRNPLDDETAITTED